MKFYLNIMYANIQYISILDGLNNLVILNKKKDVD